MRDRLLRIANLIDGENPLLADRMERLAVNATPAVDQFQSSLSRYQGPEGLQLLQSLLQTYEQQVQQAQSAATAATQNRGLTDKLFQPFTGPSPEVFSTQSSLQSLTKCRDEIAARLQQLRSEIPQYESSPASGNSFGTVNEQMMNSQTSVSGRSDALGQTWGYDATGRPVVTKTNTVRIEFADKDGYPMVLDATRGASASPMGFSLPAELFDRVQQGDSQAMEQARQLAEQHILTAGS